MRRAVLPLVLMLLPVLFMSSSAQVSFYLYGGGSFAPGDNVVLNTWLDRPLDGQLTVFRISDPGQVLELGGPMQFEAAGQLDMTEFRTVEVAASGSGSVDINVGSLPPGMYFAQLSEGDVSGATMILVTDLALVVKSDADQLLVYSADLITGEPRPTTVYAFGTAYETGADGLMSVPVPEGTESEREVAASAGDAWAFNDVWWSDWGVEQPLAYIVTDRSVYRPGHKVMIKGTVRGSRSVTPVSDTTATLSITDADYTEIFSREFLTDEYGSFETEINLPAFAPLGNYGVRVTVDERSSWSSFWVEEYELPEYEVVVTASDPYAIQGDTAAFEVDAQYLFGGPVAGATVEYVVMEQEFSPFTWRSRHGFYDDSSHTWGGNIIDRGEATLGADGTVTLPVTLPRLDHDYRLTLQAGVWDESNRQISSSASLIGYRADLIFGVDTPRYASALGEQIEVTVRAADLEGNPLSTDFELVTRRHYWEDDSSHTAPGPRFSGTTGLDGEAVITFSPEVAGSWELVVSGTDEADRFTDRSRFVWVYGESAWYWDYQSLEIEADKPEYQVGETARFVIRSPVADSVALISLEGEGLKQWELVSFQGNSLTYELTVTDESFPNSHLGVVVVGDGSMYSNFVSYHVDPAERFLDIVLESDADTYEPGERGEFSVRVTDETGAGVHAQLTLALVDDALFLIRPDTTQDIREYFYSWRANVVSTSLSSFAWFGQATPLAAREPMTEAVFGQGKDTAQDAAAELEDARVREDFRETIVWLPTLETDEDGNAGFTVDFPDNLTRWRLTARAVTLENEVGQATQTVTTTLPVLARLAMPTYLIRGDESQLRVIGQSNLEDAVLAHLGLEAEGLELISAAPDTQLLLAPAARVTADFRVRAAETGTAVVRAEVLTSEASDALRLELPVLPHAIRNEIVQSGESDMRWNFRLPENVSRLEGNLTITPSLTAAVTGALEYLVGTPYGAAEQTLNRFLPSLLAVRAGKQALLPDAIAQELDDYVAEGARRLQDLQHGDGGWGFWYWDVSHPAISANVIIALIEARSAGYPVSDWVLDRGLEYLENAVAVEAYQVYDDLTGEENRTATADAKAWIWYALALAGRSADSMSEVAGSAHLSNHGLAVSILAFSAAGQSVEAQLHMDELLSRVSESEASAYWDSGAPRYTWGDDRVSTTARALQGLAALQPGEPLIAKVVNWLLLERRGTHWYSTRDTAAVIAAALALDAEAEPGIKTVTLRTATGEERTIELEQDAFTTDISDLLVQGSNTLNVEAPAGIYTSAAVAYYAEGDYPAAENSGIGVTRRYESLEPVWDPASERLTFQRSTTDDVEVGDFVLVSVTLTPTGSYRYVMVNEPIPAGFSVVEDDRPFRIAGIAPRYGEDYWGWNYWYDGRTIHQAHVDYYFWRVNNPVTFTYVLRAEHPGEFTALPSTAWLMYEPDLNGRSAQEKLGIRPQE